MRVLVASGRLPLPYCQGGDGVSLEILIERAEREIPGSSIMHLGSDAQPTDRLLAVLADNSYDYTIDDDSSIRFTLGPNSHGAMVPGELFAKELPNYIAEFKPDVVLTQINQSHVVVRAAATARVPVIHFVHDCDPLNLLTLEQSDLIAHVFYNSRYVEAAYADRVACSSSVLYPVWTPERHVAEHRSGANDTFLAFNPSEIKGRRILADLAQRGGIQLKVVAGRDAPGTELIDLGVQVADWNSDVRSHFAGVRCTLVPSQYEEAFGRVAIESMANGIPVIASHVGGLPEAVGNGGLLVSRYWSPGDWLAPVHQIRDDDTLHAELAQAGRGHASRFRADVALESFIDCLKRVL